MPSSGWFAAAPLERAQTIRLQEPIMQTITAREVRKLREAGEKYLMVNTLPAEHFVDTKIPDAISVPQTDADFTKRVEKHAGGKDAPVIVYCASINCDSSTRGAEKLIAAGFTN